MATDGKVARVFVDVAGSDEEVEESLEGLNASRGFIRHALTANLGLRHAPELMFVLDRRMNMAAGWKNCCSESRNENARIEPGPKGMLDEVLNQIGRRQRFILTSHARPDGDAVGSALACCQILRSMGKQADVVLSDGVPVIYRPLPYAIPCC